MTEKKLPTYLKAPMLAIWEKCLGNDHMQIIIGSRELCTLCGAATAYLGIKDYQFLIGECTKSSNGGIMLLSGMGANESQAFVIASDVIHTLVPVVLDKRLGLFDDTEEDRRLIKPITRNEITGEQVEKRVEELISIFNGE